ncbi:MAG: polysaccharide deacetylase family protein [Bacteroidota bacterium]
MEPVLIVYCRKITPRIQYILDLILGDILGLKFSVTTENLVYEAFEGARICYHNQPVVPGKELIILPHGLLTEKGINSHQLSFIDFDGSRAFFPVYSKHSPIPFDLLAASFYMVSRYEEYLPYMRDEHGRFSAKSGIAAQQGFLHVPVVNRWAIVLKKHLLELFPSLVFRSNKFSFLPTIDIDAAWSYKNKGLIRTLGGYLKDIGKLDLAEMKKRTRVLLRTEKDPFDTYQLMLEIHSRYHLKPYFFILFSDYGLNDKNVPVNNAGFQTLVKSLADYAKVGIHPSYASNTNPVLLSKEIARLSQVLKSEVTASRQHFLKLSLPESYRNLINLDITDDFTMGFAGQPGFRAGICTPFKWYDLEAETPTELNIHPFAIMDGTLRDYLNMEADDAILQIQILIDQVKAVDGTFISLWHNESFSNEKRWVGWVNVYERMLDYIFYADNHK